MKKILYVDDEPINLKLFELSFKCEYTVLTAMSGKEGLEILGKDPGIDIIVSDLRMPEMDGLEFIKVIKERDPHKICLLLTAYIESDVMLEGFNKDLLFRYITKPWNKEEMAETLRAAIEKAQTGS